MVVLGHAAVHIVKAHPQEAVGLSAERFPVEEVAPAAHALTDEETQGYNIQHRAGVDFFHLAEYDDTKNRADDAAVNGQAALPHVKHGQRILGITALLPIENAVIQPGADEGEGSHPQHAVGKGILHNTELGAPAAGIKYCQQQACGDENAVEMDAEGADVNVPDRVPINAKSRE